ALVLGEAHAVDLAVLVAHRPADGREEARGAPDEGGLPAAVERDEAGDLAAADVEREVLEDELGAVADGDAVERDELGADIVAPHELAHLETAARRHRVSYV